MQEDNLIIRFMQLQSYQYLSHLQAFCWLVTKRIMSKIKIVLILANLFLGFAIYLTFKNDNEKGLGTNTLLISALSKFDSLKLDSGNLAVIELTKISKLANRRTLQLGS